MAAKLWDLDSSPKVQRTFAWSFYHSWIKRSRLQCNQDFRCPIVAGPCRLFETLKLTALPCAGRRRNVAKHAMAHQLSLTCESLACHPKSDLSFQHLSYEIWRLGQQGWHFVFQVRSVRGFDCAGLIAFSQNFVLFLKYSLHLYRALSMP